METRTATTTAPRGVSRGRGRDRARQPRPLSGIWVKYTQLKYRQERPRGGSRQQQGQHWQQPPKRNGKDGDNIAPGFRISGLGQLIEAGIEADRLLVFGD